MNHCEESMSSDGRRATFKGWQRYGTDPTELRSFENVSS
ncbi:DUF7693 family protein [Pseudomonas sp. GG8]